MTKIEFVRFKSSISVVMYMLLASPCVLAVLHKLVFRKTFYASKIIIALIFVNIFLIDRLKKK